MPVPPLVRTALTRGLLVPDSEMFKESKFTNNSSGRDRGKVSEFASD